MRSGRLVLDYSESVSDSSWGPLTREEEVRLMEVLKDDLAFLREPVIVALGTDCSGG